MNRRYPIRPAGLRLAAFIVAGLLGALPLAGCGPGSGGSGLPENTAGAAPPAPPPSSEPMPPPSACPGPTGESVVPYFGTVRAVEAGCLLVGERWIVLDGAQIQRRGGPAASPADLVVGTVVTVTPRSDDAARALVVLIEGTD